MESNKRIKKHKGSALVWIMALIMMFSILSLAVGDFFLNSNKINEVYSENEELEYASKSASEIGKYFLLDDDGKLQFNESTSIITIPKEYISNKLKNSETLKQYKYDIKCYRKNEENNMYVLQVKVSGYGKELIKDYRVKLDSK